MPQPFGLSDEQRQGAYAAWALARDDILAKWREGEDTRTLQPTVPLPMRDAAALLRRVTPSGMSKDDIDTAIDALEAPYAPRIQRMFKDVLVSGRNERETAQALVELVRELGLRPAPTPEPLPVIAEDDIHLVCWMALAPTEAPS